MIVSRNLLTNTAAPVSRTLRSNAFASDDFIIKNNYATDGVVYLEIRGWEQNSTPCAFDLWQSYNGGQWFKNTDLCSWSTANSSAFPVSNLGGFLRLQYNIGVSKVTNLRATIELYEKN